MNLFSKIRAWDERRDLFIPGDRMKTIQCCIKHLIATYQKSVADHGHFTLVLAGGSTPKELYKVLCASPYKEEIDWQKVFLFWGDERPVPETDPESNYHMAMEAGFKSLPIPKKQIYRMCAEENIEQNALAYEKKIREVLKGRGFDFILLGMGEDGHTASLFPHTGALHVKEHLVFANDVPQLNSYRMTLTYPCINSASASVIFILGASKKEVVAKVLAGRDQFELYPVQAVGTKENKALWLLDQEAGSLLT